MRTLAVILISMVALGPQSAYACSGVIDCLFGFSERTEIRADRDIEQARIQAAAQAETTRLQGEADAAIKRAEAEVEQVRMAQYASRAAADLAIAQAQAQAEQYKTMIRGLTDEKLAGIQANADTQMVALQEQARIAVAGITETGATERYRIVGGWATVIVALILSSLVALYWMRRSAGKMMVLSQPRVALGERPRLPWYSEDVQIVEAKNNVVTRR